MDHGTYLMHHKRHCAGCGTIGNAGGMLLQPGRVWVHTRCAKPTSVFGVEQKRLRACARHWRRKLQHCRREPWAEKEHRREA